MNSGVIAPFFQSLGLVILFFLPLLAARIIADERAKGTIDLLNISPKSSGGIVLGKFFASSIFVFFVLFTCCVLPLLLCFYGNPEYGPFLSGFIGLLLYSLGFLSLALAVSAFSPSPLVATLLAFLFLFFLYMIHVPAESLEGSVALILQWMSPRIQLSSFLTGSITLSGVVYFLSLMLFGLSLSARALELERRS